MDHGRRWICSARSDAGTGSIGADGGVSANSHRRRDIAATGEETLRVRVTVGFDIAGAWRWLHTLVLRNIKSLSCETASGSSVGVPTLCLNVGRQGRPRADLWSRD
jgi:hypothetical protein